MKGDTFQMLLSSRAWLVTCEERRDTWVTRFLKYHHYVLDTPFEVPGPSLRGGLSCCFVQFTGSGLMHVT